MFVIHYTRERNGDWRKIKRSKLVVGHLNKQNKWAQRMINTIQLSNLSHYLG